MRSLPGRFAELFAASDASQGRIEQAVHVLREETYGAVRQAEIGATGVIAASRFVMVVVEAT